MDSLTQRQMILLTAKELDSFTLPELFVRAWTKFPKVFGLTGFTDKHLDTHKMSSVLMGKRGLIQQGFIVKGRGKLYRYNHEKVQLQENKSEKKTFGPETRLDRLLSSVAYCKYKNDPKDITFLDACVFWELKNRTNSKGIERTTQFIQKLLSDQNTAKYRADGSTVSISECRLLFNLHNYMLDRFKQHITIWLKKGESYDE